MNPEDETWWSAFDSFQRVQLAEAFRIQANDCKNLHHDNYEEGGTARILRVKSERNIPEGEGDWGLPEPNEAGGETA